MERLNKIYPNGVFCSCVFSLVSNPFHKRLRVCVCVYNSHEHKLICTQQFNFLILPAVHKDTHRARTHRPYTSSDFTIFRDVTFVDFLAFPHTHTHTISSQRNFLISKGGNQADKHKQKQFSHPGSPLLYILFNALLCSWKRTYTFRLFFFIVQIVNYMENH